MSEDIREVLAEAAGPPPDRVDVDRLVARGRRWQRRRRLAAVAAGLLVLTVVGVGVFVAWGWLQDPDAEPPPVIVSPTAEPTAGPSPSVPDADGSVSPSTGPSLSGLEALRAGRWRDRDGNVVDEKAITAYRGAPHCDWQQVIFLVMGWPPGQAWEDDEQMRQYVRDPTETFDDDDKRAVFDADVSMPQNASFSGYSAGDVQLWFADDADDADDAAYLQFPDHVERWPRLEFNALCS